MENEKKFKNFIKDFVDDTKPIKSECRRAFHVKRGFNNQDNLILSLRDTYEDGTVKKYIKVVDNYQRPYYVTKKPYRKHKQKKSVESKEYVQTFYTTDSELHKDVPLKLDFPYNKRDYWGAKDSPYLYGTDQTAEFLCKVEYNTGVKKDLYEYAALDIETDVLNKYDDEIIIQSVAKDKQVYIAIQEAFLKDIDNPLEKLQTCVRDHLGEYLDEGLEIEYNITDPYNVIKSCFDKLHEWRPDVVGIWNINFDMPKIEEALKKMGKDIRDVVSDPDVPKNSRRYKYVEGPSEIYDRNNTPTRLGYHQRWHSVYSTSYFELLDAMCVFAELRSQDAKRPSYSLDAILDEFLNLRKLTFKHIRDETEIKRQTAKDKQLIRLIDGLESLREMLYVKSDIQYDIEHHHKGLKHHMMMQSKYPIEYCVYNIFDTYAMILLENAIQDMTLKLPIFMGDTPVRDLKRRAKRLSDTVHLYAAKRDLVAGTAYGRYPDIKTLDLNGWIITADAYMRRDEGTKCIKSNPNHRTSIYCNALDVDLVSSYPEIYRATRHSRSTTLTTVADIDGKYVTIEMRRHMINVMHGAVNAMDVNHHLFKKPSAQAVLLRVGELLATT